MWSRFSVASAGHASARLNQNANVSQSPQLGCISFLLYSIRGQGGFFCETLRECHIRPWAGCVPSMGSLYGASMP